MAIFPPRTWLCLGIGAPPVAGGHTHRNDAAIPLRRLRLGLIVGVLLVALAGCGSQAAAPSNSGSPAATAPGTSSTSLAKTKFVLHAGLAFGAFHRYIYRPFRAGRLGGNPLTHKLAYLKAGLAGLFAYHEMRLALVDARSSPLLRRLLAPIAALSATLQSLATRLKDGHADSTAIGGAQSSVNRIGSQAAAAGQSVHDLSTPSLGL